jgi:hypothetical protein
MNAVYRLAVLAPLQITIVTVATLVGCFLGVVPTLALAALAVHLFLPCPNGGCWVGFGLLIIVGPLFGIFGSAGGVLGFVYGMTITFWRST